MSKDYNTQGGTHEQLMKAGQKSHKSSSGSMPDEDMKCSGGAHGGAHEQHVQAGQQGHKTK